MPIGEKKEPGSADESREQQEPEIDFESWTTEQLKDNLWYVNFLLSGIEINRKHLGEGKKFDEMSPPDFIASVKKNKAKIEKILAEREQTGK